MCIAARGLLTNANQIGQLALDAHFLPNGISDAI